MYRVAKRAKGKMRSTTWAYTSVTTTPSKTSMPLNASLSNTFTPSCGRFENIEKYLIVQDYKLEHSSHFIFCQFLNRCVISCFEVLLLLVVRLVFLEVPEVLYDLVGEFLDCGIFVHFL